MTQIVVTVPEERSENVQQWLAEQGLAFEVQAEDNFVPEWHKKILDERMANARPEDYEDWEVVKERLKNRRK